jgi:Ca2+-binding RTX toxin-like protein
MSAKLQHNRQGHGRPDPDGEQLLGDYALFIGTDRRENHAPPDDKIEIAFGKGGSDRLLGGPMGDELTGGKGADHLVGTGGEDHLIDAAGNDRLVGGDGADTLMGGDGNDYLDEGAGHGDLEGGPSDDV